ncbi:GvpL/GvpF family gas vesicle protein [Streptomyces albus subsp. chlorinus]|uniref:GvpL/GvpF family gas vesicle protein n=1 Tax=Streptomyces albus TaxID=1888 RepID=UPI00156FA78B|nr:GvpL/GvpF family gas vesicle protein [Streptomyces albus]NSC23833.1 GvpL/GvpF family gas vesicle protein [Streptomyces albus subsp. chlorinus]
MGTAQSPGAGQPTGTPQTPGTAQPSGATQPSGTAQPSGATQPPGTTQPCGAAQPSGSAQLYVYGIVHAGRALPARLRGVGRPPAQVRLLPVGELAAVVSDVPDDLRARRRDLMAHQELLTRLGTGAPVLPMRFGMVAEDAATVERAVAAAAPTHLAALARISGRTEMNLKAMPAQSQVEALVREDPGLRRLMAQVRARPGYEANVRLGQAVAEGLARRASSAADAVLAELRPLADGFVRGPDVPGCVLNGSFLVPDTASERFREVVERFAAAHRDRVELRLTGPLPCYSFVPQEGERPEPAPAKAGHAAVGG